MLHRGFGMHARHVAGIAASDPQCGFKGFRNDAAKILFGLSRLDGSHVRARDPMAMMLELVCLRLLHRGKKPLARPERAVWDLVDDGARELP